MKLFRISQGVNNDYDTYDSAVVCAESAEQARDIHPGRYVEHPIDWEKAANERYSAWCWHRDEVCVEEVGEAAPSTKPGVVVASFNAG